VLPISFGRLWLRPSLRLSGLTYGMREAERNNEDNQKYVVEFNVSY
jgi:hypothetical protein